MDLWLILAGALVIVALLALLMVVIERKRDAAVALAGEELSLTYRRDGQGLLGEAFKRFNLFREGRRRRVRNLLQGAVEDIEAILFDYRFVTGSHRHHRTWQQTVAAYHLVGRSLPEFSLRREGWLHKIGEVLGYQDIDFDDTPTFSDRFLLRGPDEEAVRRLFTADVRRHFEQHGDDWSVEGGGDWLIIYRRGRRSPPEELDRFLRATFELCVQFAIR